MQQLFELAGIQLCFIGIVQELGITTRTVKIAGVGYTEDDHGWNLYTLFYVFRSLFGCAPESKIQSTGFQKKSGILDTKSHDLFKTNADILIKITG